MGAAIRLHLVRHGRPAAGFGEAHDPGLDGTGRAQAEALAARLAPLGPLPIVVSPMRRTRETAAALERAWDRPARVEPAVAEIPSPRLGLDARAAWLSRIMAGNWSTLDADLRRWRAEVIATLTGLVGPGVVVSHFIAINVAVGQALGDDRVRVFAPDHCSVTVIEVANGRIRLIARGAEADSRAL